MGKVQERESSFFNYDSSNGSEAEGERVEERCKQWIKREIARWRHKKSFVCGCVCVCVCMCVAHMQVSVESNGVCVTLVMQVSGNVEMSVLCVRRLVKPGPTCIKASPLLH